MWMSVGSYTTGIPLYKLPYPNGTCFQSANVSMTTVSTTMASMATSFINTTSTPTDVESERSGLSLFYGVSYLWFNSIGTATVIVVGLVVSFITGPNAKRDIPTRYQIPLFSRLFCCLPDSLLYKLNCCRYFDRPEDIKAEEKSADLKASAEDIIIISENTPSAQGVKQAGFFNEGYIDSPDPSPDYYGPSGETPLENGPGDYYGCRTSDRL
jgi:hypothetical protein